MSHLRRSFSKERIKWADPDRLHVTMTFIGDTTTDQVNSIGDILEKYVPLYPAPVIRIHDMGVFRNLKNPRVIWLGMDPVPVLSDLKIRIDKLLGEIGLSVELRVFKPHLTMGRIKSLNNKDLLAEMIKEHQGMLFQEELISELVLFRSILKPEGPQYIPLRRARFKHDGP
jgi:2'-5' RNA ligase